MFSPPHAVVAPTIANGKDFQELAEWGELALQGWSFCPLSRWSLVEGHSSPNHAALWPHGQGEPFGWCLLTSLVAAAVKRCRHWMCLENVGQEYCTTLWGEQNIGLKKRKRWEREGKERGKSRQLSPGMKMEFTADYKEWWMGEFACWHKNILWKNKKSKTKLTERGLMC